MHDSYSKSIQFLRAPIGSVPRLLLAVSAAFIVLAHTLPLWNLTMFAPQYPQGLRLDIYDHALVGGNDGHDVKEINLLNHYIGMRDLAEEDFTEFRWMPFVMGGLTLIALRAVVLGSVKELTDTVAVFIYFGAFSLWSFGSRLYLYGHNLAADAPVKVAPFTPPVFGRQQIANFEVYSYPQSGTYILGIVLVLLVAAIWRAWREAQYVRES